MPSFRELPRRLIEDFEVYFIKEQVTKGFQIQKVDENGDYIYILYRGVCQMLYPSNKMPEMFVESPIFDPVK